MREYAVNMTEKDKSFLETVKANGGLVTVGSGGLRSCGFEGNGRIVVWRVKRLIALGALTPNEDGLFDGCSQTYSVVGE